MKVAIEAKPELFEQDIQDKSLINSMISEVEFALQWMVFGRNPDARRGADRTGASLDPKLIEAVVPNKTVEKGRKITADEK